MGWSSTTWVHGAGGGSIGSSHAGEHVRDVTPLPSANSSLDARLIRFVRRLVLSKTQHACPAVHNSRPRCEKEPPGADIQDIQSRKRSRAFDVESSGDGPLSGWARSHDALIRSHPPHRDALPPHSRPQRHEARDHALLVLLPTTHPSSPRHHHFRLEHRPRCGPLPLHNPSSPLPPLRLVVRPQNTSLPPSLDRISHHTTLGTGPKNQCPMETSTAELGGGHAQYPFPLGYHETARCVQIHSAEATPAAGVLVGPP